LKAIYKNFVFCPAETTERPKRRKKANQRPPSLAPRYPEVDAARDVEKTQCGSLEEGEKWKE
jgi:hypothetical protein